MFEDNTREKILRARNKSKYREGFDVSDSSDNDIFGDNNNSGGGLFDDADELFGDDNSNNNSNMSRRPNNEPDLGALGDMNYENDSLVKVDKEQSTEEKIFDSIFKSLLDAWSLLTAIFQSFARNTLDDSLTVFRNIAIIAGGILIVTAASFFFGYINDETRIMSIGANTSIASILNILVGILVCSIGLLTAYKPKTIDEIIEEAEEEAEKDAEENGAPEIVELQSEYSRSMEDIMKEVMADDIGMDEEEIEKNEDEENETDIFGGNEEDSEDEEDDEEDEKEDEEEERTLSFDEEEPVEENDEEIKVNKAGIMNREILFDTFFNVFPQNVPQYSKVEKITLESDKERYEKMEETIIKALAKAINKDEEELAEKVEVQPPIRNSIMSIELRVNRNKLKGKINLASINEQIDSYNTDIINLMCDKRQLFDKEEDNRIATRSYFDGDFIDIIISKPNKKPILVGDVIKKEEIRDYICDESQEFPVVLGINELGQPIKADYRSLNSGLIGGLMDGGKSWFTISIFSQMALFHSPEELQFLIIDPKGTPLLKNFSYLPHCAGLLAGDDVKSSKLYLRAIDDIITKESGRRMKILQDAGCDKIWDYRKKGNKMPLLIVFIDEMMTIRDNLEKLDDAKRKISKEWDNAITSMVTRLRSQGIFFLGISHRFTGSIKPAVRILAPLRVILRNNDIMNEVFEKEEIKDFKKRLVNMGDSAVRILGGDVKYMKTLGLCKDDESTGKFLRKVARGFYNMNCPIPDMSSIGTGYTRDEEAIKKVLFEEEKE